ncbi:MAG: hypothetical protein GXN99_01495, partial [Candidatus Nanohaloarchaeota archaeon]|nr:hypothetical protein [Candidatus Nanohaloarchaeota archaeon]
MGFNFTFFASFNRKFLKSFLFIVAVFLWLNLLYVEAYADSWATHSLSNLGHRGTYKGFYDVGYFKAKVNLTYLKGCNVTRALFVTNWKEKTRIEKTACILTEYNPSRCLPFLPRNYYIADITEPIQKALAGSTI